MSDGVVGRMNCVIRALEGGDVLTLMQIAERSERSPRTVEHILAKLRKSGIVQMVDRVPVTRCIRYRISAEHMCADKGSCSQLEPQPARIVTVKAPVVDLPVRRRAPAGMVDAAMASRTALEVAWGAR